MIEKQNKTLHSTTNGYTSKKLTKTRNKTRVNLRDIKHGT